MMHLASTARSASLLAGLAVWMAGTSTMAEAADTAQKMVADGERLSQACVPCHGEQGISSNPAIPSLAGQHVDYLNHALGAFRQGVRTDATMNAIAGQYSVSELRRLAAYFASRPYVRPSQETDSRKVDRGRAVSAKVCAICHLDNGSESSYADYPRLAGQGLAYLQKSMADIVSYRRPVDAIMRGMIHLVAPDDLDNALHFFAAQVPGAAIVQGESSRAR